MEVTGYTPGDFCWPELATTDPGGAKSFYASLFGWKARDSDLGAGASRSILEKDGKDVAALREETRVAPFWMSYVSVRSVEATAERTRELGGAVTLPPTDVADHGRMAVVSDPLGASFGLWQPRRHFGSRLMGDDGSFCWNELYAPDVERAKAFYAALLGWRADSVTMSTPPYRYTLFSLGEIRVAGMMDIPADWGPMPAHWLVYFAVEDCDAMERTARGLGATSVFPPSTIQDVGRLTILKDPQGAAFALFRAMGR
jgi:predicted enzyme related to lactoylglutathione lyase